MPMTSLYLPDDYLPWMERKRKELGIRSRQAFILLAIKELARVPAMIPSMVDRGSWPVTDQPFVCCECAGSTVRRPEHCGGGVRDTIYDDDKEVGVRWICVCKKCDSGEIVAREDRPNGAVKGTVPANITSADVRAFAAKGMANKNAYIGSKYHTEECQHWMGADCNCPIGGKPKI